MHDIMHAAHNHAGALQGVTIHWNGLLEELSRMTAETGIIEPIQFSDYAAPIVPVV